MKNTFKVWFWILISIVILTLVLMLGYFTYKTQDYWTKLYETKANKIELRKESSVDSLLNVIEYHDSIYTKKYTHIIDSLNLVITKQNTRILENNKTIKQYRQIIDNQNKLIKHEISD